MSPISGMAFTAQGVVNVSKSERNCLEILSNYEVLNAYEIRKRSNYKHYATILRAVKKLNEKGLISSILDDSRNSTNYSIKYGGLIYHYLISEKDEEANNLIIEKSSRFRDISEEFLSHRWGNHILRQIYEIVISNEIRNKEYNINSEIEGIIEDTIGGYLTDIINDIAYDYVSFEIDELKQIIKYSKKYNWIYNITEKNVQDGLNWTNKMHIAYKKINAILESEL